MGKGIIAYTGPVHNPPNPHPIPKIIAPIISPKLTGYLGSSISEANTGVTLKNK